MGSFHKAYDAANVSGIIESHLGNAYSVSVKLILSEKMWTANSLP